MAYPLENDLFPLNIFEENYQKLNKILINGFNDLAKNEGEIWLIPQLAEQYSIQILSLTQEKLDIALTHYYTNNGDLVLDPEFVLRVYPELKILEVMQYHDKFGIQKSYHSDGRINPEIKIQLNQYFGRWVDMLNVD